MYSGGALKTLAEAVPPRQGGTFSFFNTLSLNNLGAVAFYALAVSPKSAYGFFLADGNSISTLALAMESPDGNGQIGNFRTSTPALNDKNEIAFVADLINSSAGQADNEGLYRADRNGISQIVRKGQIVPDKNGRFLDFSPQGQVSINNRSTIAFWRT